MALIRLQRVSTAYSLKNIDLTVKDGELMVVLGTTGAGKTTLLNVISGLADYSGSVSFDGKPVDNLPVQQRNIGYLFQELLLFPHMNVFKNIAFPLRRLHIDAVETEARVDQLLNLLGIESLKHRYPNNLSGGEKQRVALARALISNPNVLLLDEPLSNLDHRTSKKVLAELHYLVKKLGITTIYVTHSFYEAEKLADRIAILDNGRLEQVGTVDDIFFSPTDRVRNFIGEPNIIDCEEVYPLKHGLMIVKCGEITLVVSDEGLQVKKIAIYPEDLRLSRIKPVGADINKAEGVLEGFVEEPFTVLCSVKLGKQRLKAILPKEVFCGMHLKPGDKIWLVFNPRKLKLCFKNDCKVV